ncbi:hypothetical protein ACH4HG_14650 [Streptomyces coeruleorubidus]|uniref:hypothetical protein n=1 Tax=Streptomyces coeruleorubidus TaxID=116188 RepID=UPI0037A04C26
MSQSAAAEAPNRAAAVHAQVVERYFVAPLDPDDYGRLTGSLGAIDKALRDT